MDIAGVVATVLPYLTAAAGAYGGAVVQRVSDQASDSAADATVGLGRRLLGRVLGPRGSRPMVEAVVTDLGERPDDEDFQAALRAQLKKLLEGDPQLARDLAAILTEAGVAAPGKFNVSITGAQGVVVGDHARQTNTFHAPPPAS